MSVKEKNTTQKDDSHEACNTKMNVRLRLKLFLSYCLRHRYRIKINDSRECFDNIAQTVSTTGVALLLLNVLR